MQLEAEVPAESAAVLNRVKDMTAAVDKQGGLIDALEARLREDDADAPSGNCLTSSQARFLLEQVFSAVRSSFMSAGPTPLSRDDAFVVIRYGRYSQLSTVR